MHTTCCDDSHVTINDLDPLDPPVFEGPLRGAGKMLMPGSYTATLDQDTSHATEDVDGTVVIVGDHAWFVAADPR